MEDRSQDKRVGEAATDAALQVDELSVGYGTAAVIQGMSFAAQRGEVTVVAGPNGAGKTTLLRTVVGALRPLAGSIALHGAAAVQYSRKQRAASVAYVPQLAQSNWPLTVRQAVTLGRATQRGWYRPLTPQDHAVVDTALQQMGVQHLAERQLGELSGGEVRRVAIGRALAQQAPLVLLDEPTAHLDLRYSHEILRLVRSLATEHNVAVVVTLHDLSEALRYGDHAVLLGETEQLAAGAPEQILHPANIRAAYGVDVAVEQAKTSGNRYVDVLD